MRELFDDTVIDPFMQDEETFGVEFLAAVELLAQFGAGGVVEHYLAVVGGFQRGVGIHVDGGVEDGSAIDVRKGGYIGATAGQSQTQGCFASDDHISVDFVSNKLCQL